MSADDAWLEQLRDDAVDAARRPSATAFVRMAPERAVAIVLRFHALDNELTQLKQLGERMDTVGSGLLCVCDSDGYECPWCHAKRLRWIWEGK